MSLKTILLAFAAVAIQAASAVSLPPIKAVKIDGVNAKANFTLGYDLPKAQKHQPFFHKPEDLPEHLRSYINAENHHLLRQNLPNPADNHTAALNRRDAPMTWHGGDVMGNTAGTNVYVIFFGNNFENRCDPNNVCTTADKATFTFLEQSQYNTWFDILLQYTGLNNDYFHTQPGLNFISYMYDGNTQSTLDDNFIPNYIANAAQNSFGVDPNALYIFLTGASVTYVGDSNSNFPNNYYGYHSWVNTNGQSLKYLFIGPRYSTVVLSHEVAETISDPFLNAWYRDGQNGGEIGDLCAWQNLQWISNYPGSSYYSVYVQPLFSNIDGGSCAYKPAYVANSCFSACKGGSSLYQNQYLTPGERITSPSGNYYFTFQNDGNIVQYTSSNQPVWATATNDPEPASFVMQGDGNLVGYYYDRAPWASNTWHKGVGPYCFTVQDDSNLVVYDSTCTATWARW